MSSFRLSFDDRSDVLRLVQSLAAGNDFAVSRGLCDRIEASVSAYLAERAMPGPPESVAQLVPLVRLLLAADPSIGLIRTKVSRVPEGILLQIEARAERLAAQVPACGVVGTDLRGWAKGAPPLELLLVLRLCLVEGGMMVPGRRRPIDRQSAAKFEAVVFGRGRGLRGGRPSDDAEVRLIAHLGVDWLVSTGAQPEAGRDGYSAFSGLVHSVFGWIEIEGKAQHCLRQYWAMVKAKGPSRR